MLQRQIPALSVVAIEGQPLASKQNKHAVRNRGVARGPENLATPLVRKQNNNELRKFEQIMC